MLEVRPAGQEDVEAIWTILEPAIRAGDTYALPRDMSRAAAISYWFGSSHEVFVAGSEREVIGTYYLRPNQLGGGSHVSNCGYMTAPAATGKGVASAMCSHSLEHARKRGFRAMQFNFVVSTNDRAVRLWQRFNFDIVGRLPSAFLHPVQGYVDAYVMYRTLLHQRPSPRCERHDWKKSELWPAFSYRKLRRPALPAFVRLVTREKRILWPGQAGDRSLEEPANQPGRVSNRVAGKVVSELVKAIDKDENRNR